MGLEAVYRKPRTSVAEPEHRVYPYLLRGLTIDRPNQVWSSDITYIPVSSGFLYLVAIMDWASRHVLAWRLSNTMDSSFCVEALEAALQLGHTGHLQHRSGVAVYEHGVHRAGSGGRRAVFDGRPRAVPGQCLHRAVVAVTEVRGGASSRVGRWVRGRSGYRGVDDVLRLRAPALSSWETHAGRSIRRGAGGVRTRTRARGMAMTGIVCLGTAAVERPLLYDALLLAIADAGWRFRRADQRAVRCAAGLPSAHPGVESATA